MDSFNCPITYERMVDPVMCLDGHTYERIAIERWIAENIINNRVTSPMTGLFMDTMVVSNHALRNAILEDDARLHNPVRPIIETNNYNDIQENNMIYIRNNAINNMLNRSFMNATNNRNPGYYI
jgi:hypothetical protein